LIYHRRAAELRLIHKNTAYTVKVFSIHLRIGEHLDIGVLLDSHSRADYLSPEAIIEGGLNKNNLLPLATIVVGDRQKVEGLCATYSAVSEIELCHAGTP
jgi:hypothetical protein